MSCVDSYGLALTASADAAAAYDRGLRGVLRLEAGAERHFATALALDPGFALAHAALALLGHEMCVRVDLDARMRDALVHAERAGARERSHVHAVAAHLRGDATPLVVHLRDHPTDALLLSVAVPTIAFAGVTEAPEQAWSIVEDAAPAYGDDWWLTGLLAFVRQEQGRYDDAMRLACASLALEPTAGHSAHARAHAHYETGDHRAGLAWMDDWLLGHGALTDSRSHFAWHAALHELSLGDLTAVRTRYDTQLRARDAVGCRPLVDTGSLLWRWALTPGAVDVPGMDEVVAVTGPRTLERPATPFLALHAAVVLLATGDRAGLRRLAERSRAHAHPVHREVVAPLADALGLMAAGRCSEAADALAPLTGPASPSRRLGGSDAQREVIEETRIAALLRAGRATEARALLDARLDRRVCRRDLAWRAEATVSPDPAPAPAPAPGSASTSTWTSTSTPTGPRGQERGEAC